MKQINGFIITKTRKATQNTGFTALVVGICENNMGFTPLAIGISDNKYGFKNVGIGNKHRGFTSLAIITNEKTLVLQRWL